MIGVVALTLLANPDLSHEAGMVSRKSVRFLPPDERPQLPRFTWSLVRSERWNLDQLIYRNHGPLCLRNSFRQEGESWIRSRFPAQPTKTFPDGRFAEAQPPSNPSITHPLGFEAKDGLVSLMGFLVPGRPSSRARESAQPTGLKALLVAAQRSD